MVVFIVETCLRLFFSAIRYFCHYTVNRMELKRVFMLEYSFSIGQVSTTYRNIDVSNNYAFLRATLRVLQLIPLHFPYITSLIYDYLLKYQLMDPIIW